nr:hypothetical protein [Candidatus Cardinium sp. cBcalN1]
MASHYHFCIKHLSCSSLSLFLSGKYTHLHCLDLSLPVYLPMERERKIFDCHLLLMNCIICE